MKNFITTLFLFVSLLAISSGSSLVYGQSNTNSSPNESAQSKVNQIATMLKNDKAGVDVYFWALGIAFILGGLHSLTPGHGKTLVAAYLVGQHGTKKDALILAGVTTITHTSSIYILGLISIFATKYFLPEKIIPLLELISAMLIFSLGIWLLQKRYYEYKGNKASNDSTYHHSHIHDSGHINHVHSLNDIPGKKNMKQIISLGFSGGLIPCPEALAIMIIAISLNKIVLGMILIAVFSLGMASVIAAIGIVMVSSKQIFDKYVPNQKVSQFFPLISSVIIILIGVVLVLKMVKVI